MPEVAFRRLHDDARVPTRAHPGDAGLDLHAIDRTAIEPGGRARVATGVAVSLPDGYAGLIVPRSGLADRHGVGLVNAPGLIDTGYRGELQVLLLNTDRAATFVVEPGDRIAQLVITRVPELDVIEVTEFDLTARGVGGFGSTGR